MMCPDSLRIFRAWVENNLPSTISFSDLFPNFVTLAALVNDVQRSGLLKGTKLKKERLEIYFDTEFITTERVSQVVNHKTS